MTDTAAPTRSPVSRGLAALGLACATAALFARGLSSGTGQALESPGATLVLDSIGAVAAMTAFGARFLDKEPGLVAEKSVLAALGAFLAVVFAGALHGAAGSWRFAFSLASLVALGLAVRDLARRPDVARLLVGAVVGTATACALLGLYDYRFEFPIARAEVEGHPELYPQAMLDRVRDPMAVGPFLLPSHFACALAMAVPLVLVVLISFVKRREKLRIAGTSVVLGALLGGVVLARSKGATLALGAGVLALALLAVTDALWRRRLVLAVSGAVLLAFAAGAVKYVRARDDFSIRGSVRVRLEYWDAALKMAKERPLAGHGLDRYAELMGRYKSARAEEAKHAHQDVLELLAELGALGPIAFLAVAAALGRAGLRALAMQGPPRAPPREKIFAPAVTVLLGLVLGALTLLVYGAPYDASHAWKLEAAVVIATAVASLVASALSEPRWTHAAAGAALAGAVVFLADGLTDFPLRVHGLVAFALALAALAPALAEGPAAPPAASKAVRAAVALPLAALLAFGQYRVHEDVIADGLRARSREQLSEALAFFHMGRPLRSEERAHVERLLREGNATQRNLLDADQLGVSDILHLVEAEEYEGRLLRDPHRIDGTRRIILDALGRFPHSRELWSELGQLESGANYLDVATEAYDTAARCYPAQPYGRLAAATIRMIRIAKGETNEKLRGDAIHECRAALACARASRLERVHLGEADIAAAQGFLIALGAAPEPPGERDPEPPLR